MGILKRFFGMENSEVKSEFDWNILRGEEEVQNILAASNDKPQIIFKHSTRCGTSYVARLNLETLPTTERDKADFYILDVIKNRPTSLYIAEKLKIRHESPQLFTIKDGEVVWHGSHYEVQVEKLTTYLKNKAEK